MVLALRMLNRVKTNKSTHEKGQRVLNIASQRAAASGTLLQTEEAIKASTMWARYFDVSLVEHSGRS